MVLSKDGWSYYNLVRLYTFLFINFHQLRKIL